MSICLGPLKIAELPFNVPGVWAKDNPSGLAQNVCPVVIELKLVFTPIPPSARNNTSFLERPRSEFKKTLTDS
jgi:hypothetical protein